MIGVAAAPADIPVVEEFFELFKTPWEPVAPDRRYPVVLSCDGRLDGIDARVLIAYGPSPCAADARAGIGAARIHGPLDVSWGDDEFPVYGAAAAFTGAGAGAGGLLRTAAGPLDYRCQVEGRDFRRIGYDLFAEVRHLLTEGQPERRALVPTLELHIALLRHLLLDAGVSFVEVPPRPAGHEFACCLTHDIDFFGLRRHGFDRTLAGFAWRASVGTLADLVKGRRRFREAARNWAALGSTPLVFMGLARDFWHPVDDYAAADAGRPSTYFVVPFRNRPGVAPGGDTDAARAVRYQASDVAGDLKEAAARGSELAVHGIDAWRDPDAGRAELAEVTALGGRPTAGVRMHWLYFDAGAASRLEDAGFDYDSTWGYNGAVGYRAGTLQAFRPPGARRLLELPLAIMDSAMFFPGRMGLAEGAAMDLCGRVLDAARRFGGNVVVNWHDRSLAPERLWGIAYRELLDRLDAERPWYASASDAVAWFRWRRDVRFTRADDGRITVHSSSAPPGLPAGTAVVRVPGRVEAGPQRILRGEPVTLAA